MSIYDKFYKKFKTPNVDYYFSWSTSLTDDNKIICQEKNINERFTISADKNIELSIIEFMTNGFYYYKEMLVDEDRDVIPIKINDWVYSVYPFRSCVLMGKPGNQLPVSYKGYW